MDNIESMGWLPDLPDWRDWDAQRAMIVAAGPSEPKPLAATSVDIRRYCSPIENQGALGSCVAQAVVGAVEYMERMAFGRHIDASRLFIYKVARQLDGIVGDRGAHIRSGFKALRVFGAPPERYWPYTTKADAFDRDPTPFVFAYGQSLQAIRHYRLDRGGRTPVDVLALLKSLVAAWRPVVFGFRVYTSNRETGEFPFPEPGQRPRGGHAVVAVGFDDDRVIGKTTGAILVRNSWGAGWGDQGYGWLPYAYVLERLSSDFWCLVRQESVMA